MGTPNQSLHTSASPALATSFIMYHHRTRCSLPGPLPGLGEQDRGPPLCATTDLRRAPAHSPSQPSWCLHGELGCLCLGVRWQGSRPGSSAGYYNGYKGGGPKWSGRQRSGVKGKGSGVRGVGGRILETMLGCRPGDTQTLTGRGSPSEGSERGEGGESRERGE